MPSILLTLNIHRPGIKKNLKIKTFLCLGNPCLQKPPWKLLIHHFSLDQCPFTTVLPSSIEFMPPCATESTKLLSSRDKSKVCQPYFGCTVNCFLHMKNVFMHMKTKSGSACFKMSARQTHGQHKLCQCTYRHKIYKLK